MIYNVQHRPVEVDDSGVIVLAPDGKINHLNLFATAALGYTPEEAVTHLHVLDILAPEVVPAHAQALSEELAAQVRPDFDALISKALIHGEDQQHWIIHAQSGATVETIVTIRPIYDKGSLAGYQIFFQ